MIVSGANMIFGQSSDYDRQKNIYKRALSYSDWNVARMALYNMMEIRPENIQLLDTLALSYFEQRQYVSAAISAQEAVRKNPNNLLMLELAGTSFENVGLNDKALEHFKSLYQKNKDVSILYKMAFLEFRLRRYSESIANCNILLADPKIKSKTMVFGKKDKTSQQVSMTAAAYRLKGLIAYDQGNNAQAIIHFKEALKYTPEFEVVTESIRQLEDN